MLKNLKIVIITLIIFAGVNFLQSCNDAPTTMGSDLLYDTLNLQAIGTSTDTLIKGFDSKRFDFNINDRGVFHIGSFQGIKALSFLKFDEPLRYDTTYDYLLNLDKSKIISCKLKFYVDKYAMGEINNPTALAFKIYKIKNDWLSSKIKDSYESAQNLFDKSKIIAEFRGSIKQSELTDSIKDIIEIDFDKELLYEWFDAWVNIRTKKDTTQKVWGVGIVSDENSSVIRSFMGDGNNPPFIELKYYSPLKPDSIITMNIAELDDKSYYEIPPPNPNELVVQGAVSTRGIIRFDISKIPQFSAIHSAELELTVNKEKSLFGSNGFDKNFRWELPVDTAIYYNLLKLDTNNRFSQIGEGYFKDDSCTKLFFKGMPRAFEQMNIKDGLGEIVIMNASSDNSSTDLLKELDKTVFYGSDAKDSSNRPILKIIYAKRPELKR